MKKRIGILVLMLCLMVPQITVNAEEKDVTKGLTGYVNMILAKTKGGSGEDSMSSLKDSLEEVIQNIKPEDAQKILDFASEKIQDGSLETKQGIENAIKEGEKKFGVTLTKEQKDLIFSVIEKVKKLGIDPQFVVDQAEEMVGKKVMVLVNLKPATLAGVMSEGMLLCAEDADGNLALLTPEKDMPAGAEIA